MNIKTIIPILASTILFASPSQELLDYQKYYTLCNETTNINIANCFLNSKVNYNNVHGNPNSKNRIDKENFVKLNQYEKEYYIMNALLPQNERYLKLENYLRFLYSIANEYEPTNFKKFEEKYTSSENIRKTKVILNLIQYEGLEESNYFDDELSNALFTFQKTHGLLENGKLWKETRRELNKSIKEIILKVKKNLEIERSVNNKAGTYVYINIPEYKMYYYVDNMLDLDMKVIVGKKRTRTPVFSDKIEFVVKNPNWNIPRNIYKKEYAHKSVEELRKKGLRYNSEGKLYQPPGKRNALGLVKFLFPNKYNVYMHDTNAKYLFKRSTRMFSHGCIRLEKPFELLNTLGYEYDTKKNRWHKLANKIPVHIEYHTVWIDENGVAQFRKDIYGYEKKLFM